MAWLANTLIQLAFIMTKILMAFNKKMCLVANILALTFWIIKYILLFHFHNINTITIQLRCQLNSFKAFAVLFLLCFPLYLLLNLNNRMNWGCTLGREHSTQCTVERKAAFELAAHSRDRCWYWRRRPNDAGIEIQLNVNWNWCVPRCAAVKLRLVLPHRRKLY